MLKTTLASVAASVLVVVGLFFAFGHGAGNLGGDAETIFKNFSAGLSIGDPGSAASPKATKIIFRKSGTCNPTFSGTSLAATSTGQFFCTGLTGVKSGDRVSIMLPAGARSGANAWFSVIDAYATTTDRIGFDIANFTGTATTSFSQATTSVQYVVERSSTNP